MTILAAEAGSAAAEAGAAESAAGAGKAFQSKSGTAPPPGGSAGRYPAARTGQAVTRRGGRTSQGQRSSLAARPRTGGRTSQGSGVGKVFPVTEVRAPRGPSGRSASRRQTAAGLRNFQRATSGIRPGKPQVTDYQMAILAEFVAAVLLTAATPFARPNNPGLSPYYGKDMIQLGALTVFYFLLALLAGASQSAARLAAWFGGLVLIVVGLGEAAALAKLLQVFGGGPSAAALAAPAAGGTSGGSGSGAAASASSGGDLGITLGGLIPDLTQAAQTVAADTPAPNTTLGNRVGTGSQAQP